LHQSYSHLFSELLNYIITFLPVGFKFGIQKIGKENQSHDYKKDKNLYENNNPEFSANSHTAETIIVEIKNPDKNIFLHPIKMIGQKY
jgi:hypothetical protein